MKLTRNVSGESLIKALKVYHYEIQRQKGSHIRLKTTLQGEHHIRVPNHDSITIGTFSSIINDIAHYFSKTKEEVTEELFG